MGSDLWKKNYSSLVYLRSRLESDPRETVQPLNLVSTRAAAASIGCPGLLRSYYVVLPRHPQVN